MRCGLCGFLIIKPQTALHHAALLLAVRGGYAISTSNYLFLGKHIKIPRKRTWEAAYALRMFMI